MWLKSTIRGHLTGKLAKLQSEIWKAYSLYTVLDAHKASRHCRETMGAYRRVADSNDIGLSELAADHEEAKLYTTHGRVLVVFDANTATLKEVSDMPVSDKEKKQAAVLAKKRDTATKRTQLEAALQTDIKSYFKRKQRSAEEVAQEKKNAKARKLKHDVQHRQ